MTNQSRTCSTLPVRTVDREAPMLREALWEEIHRLFTTERQSKAAVARTLDLDRKTVRTCLAQKRWSHYQRPPQAETLLSAHRAYLEQRAPGLPQPLSRSPNRGRATPCHFRTPGGSRRGGIRRSRDWVEVGDQDGQGVGIGPPQGGEAQPVADGRARGGPRGGFHPHDFPGARDGPPRGGEGEAERGAEGQREGQAQEEPAAAHVRGLAGHRPRRALAGERTPEGKPRPGALPQGRRGDQAPEGRHLRGREGGERHAVQNAPGGPRSGGFPVP